jgi:hypothetical protein
MSEAGEECSFGRDTDNFIGCAIAAADSVYKDINDNDDQTVGCAIARAAHWSSFDSKNISDKDNASFAATCYPVGLKSDGGGKGSVLVDNAQEKNHSSTLSATSNNLLCLSDQLKIWMSKFTMRDGNQLIDVSSAACGSSSTILIGATQQNFPYAGTVYQFYLMLFYNPDHKFDINDAEAKLFALMKSPHADYGCKLVQHS